jgi:DNA-binding MurR/RpiR family transcriptional regulator
MKNALIRLREGRDGLNPAEYAAADYVLADPQRASTLSVHELADKAFVSSSAVIRMCRDLGFEGYKDFRSSLTVEIALRDENMSLSREDIEKGDSISEIIQKITYKNVQSLLDTQHLMDTDTLQKCVALLEKAKSVILFGLGASWLAGRDAYEKLLRINKPCTINEDWHLQLLSARNSTRDDVGVVISYSGQTTEMIECMKAMKDNHTPIIVITRCVDSPISELADYKLYTTANESLFRSAAMSSRISQLDIIDILYTALANDNYENCIKQLKKTHIVKP